MALRTIEKGEEITIAYCCAVRKTVAHNAKEFFRCGCSMCSGPWSHSREPLLPCKSCRPRPSIEDGYCSEDEVAEFARNPRFATTSHDMVQRLNGEEQEQEKIARGEVFLSQYHMERNVAVTRKEIKQPSDATVRKIDDDENDILYDSSNSEPYHSDQDDDDDEGDDDDGFGNLDLRPGTHDWLE